MHVTTKNVLFCTSILIVKLKTARGTIEVFVVMDLIVGIITFVEFYVRIMWLDFVLMVRIANLCSTCVQFIFFSVFFLINLFICLNFTSPRFELPAGDVGQKDPKKLVVICHFCGDTKHKAMYCDKVSHDVKDQLNNEEMNVSHFQSLFYVFLFDEHVRQFFTVYFLQKLHQNGQHFDATNPQKLILKPLESVTCYKVIFCIHLFKYLLEYPCIEKFLFICSVAPKVITLTNARKVI